MESCEPSRYRLRFSKAGAMRFTSHLDLQRAWERTFLRAGLPIAFSQGYSPRPRLNLGLALPLGFASQCELMDVWLERAIPADSILERLTAHLPPGLSLHAVDEVQEGQAPLQTQVDWAQYRVRIPAEQTPPDLEARVFDLLSEAKLPLERRGKQYDLRPLIHSLHLLATRDESVLSMRLSARQGATGRPDEVLRALGLDPHSGLIERIEIRLFPADPETGTPQNPQHTAAREDH